MRLFVPLAVVLCVALGSACSTSSATECVPVVAAGTEKSAAALAEVRTDKSGSRTVRSSEGVTVTSRKDGSLEVVGVDGKKIVVGADGAVRSAERDVRVVLADGTSKVFDLVAQSLLTEKDWTDRRSGGGSGGASAAKTAGSVATSAEREPEADEAGEADESDKSEKAVICHVPPGNPANQHTLSVGASAVDAHLKHGDYEGECDPARASAEKDKGKDKGDGGESGGKGGNGHGNGKKK